ncbi:hypothetical protein RPMA_26110 [Tardiphaga alba]|uniref:Uncharacterized protein n=1 Tax=Tardiphaga alba TaxID=340268 RepID=A0ABX8ADX1_9BRAD|nr:hypothetical protein [Tardiphaga alba]QUS41922.1 hypothetical protein RPMA_26110 [Tardiphaga alba]
MADHENDNFAKDDKGAERPYPAGAAFAEPLSENTTHALTVALGSGPRFTQLGDAIAIRQREP